MAGHSLITHHLTVLADHLPRPVVEELADGLIETWEHLLDTGLGPEEAASLAIADFGDRETIINAFIAQAQGRRVASMLLLTGPLVAACWAASLVTARAWTWPVPLPVTAGLGATLIAVVAGLTISATSRRSYRRARLGAAGAVGVVVVDTGMLAVVILAAPVFVWPMAAAISVSLARITMTLRALIGASAH